ncbi:MAG TPA: chondroitin AC lyase, partial [Chitinophagaceae bacterium]|nr:chondroitin AC lyase [Chitinophagaceae bacterium]
MRHLQRVGQMVVAWANPRSSWYHRDTLRGAINSALDYWLYNRYYNPNGWYNEIGVPRDMQNILILLRPHLTKYQRIRGLQEMDQYRINGTGSNLIWSAGLGFHYRALTGDSSLMWHCMDTILHEIKITTGEGIQPDYSFHMHGNRLQIYSYGIVFLRENINLAMECKGTPWAFPPEKTHLLADFVLQGWLWMARGIHTAPGTIDRSVSRKGILHAADIRDLIPRLASLCPARAGLNALAAR